MLESYWGEFSVTYVLAKLDDNDDNEVKSRVQIGSRKLQGASSNSENSRVDTRSLALEGNRRLEGSK